MEYTKENWPFEFFSFEEMACKESKRFIAPPQFCGKLDGLRSELDFPLNVNSGARSKTHNAAISGHPRSLHVYDEPHHPTGGCIAVDISQKGMSGEQKADFWELALIYGWSVGIADTFYHIDLRTAILGMPQVVYHY